MNTTMRYDTTYSRHYSRAQVQNRNRKRYNASVSKRVLFVAITVIAILLGIMIGNNVLSTSHSSAYSTVEKELRYTSVEIEAGDTLWTIAEAYMCSEYDDINDYIYDVMQINNLASDEIHAGGYLMVPYYEVIE